MAQSQLLQSAAGSPSQDGQNTSQQRLLAPAAGTAMSANTTEKSHCQPCLQKGPDLCWSSAQLMRHLDHSKQKSAVRNNILAQADVKTASFFLFFFWTQTPETRHGANVLPFRTSCKCFCLAILPSPAAKHRQHLCPLPLKPRADGTPRIHRSFLR